MLENGIIRFEHATAQFFAAIVEFGQHPDTQPGGVIVRMVVEGEEVGFR